MLVGYFIGKGVKIFFIDYEGDLVLYWVCFKGKIYNYIYRDVVEKNLSWFIYNYSWFFLFLYFKVILSFYFLVKFWLVKSFLLISEVIFVFISCNIFC